MNAWCKLQNIFSKHKCNSDHIMRQLLDKPINIYWLLVWIIHNKCGKLVFLATHKQSYVTLSHSKWLHDWSQRPTGRPNLFLEKVNNLFIASDFLHHILFSNLFYLPSYSWRCRVGICQNWVKNIIHGN